MLSHDLINLSRALAEAATTGRAMPEMMADAARQLTGMAAQAAALETHPIFIGDAAPPHAGDVP